jgi:hypothetical protein
MVCQNTCQGEILMEHRYNRFVAILVLIVLPAIITATQVWPDPLHLFSAENLSFTGKGVANADGSYALAWIAEDNTGQTHSFFQAFTAANLPQTDYPICLPLTSGFDDISSMIATSDGNFLVFTDSRVFCKLSPSGDVLWSVAATSQYMNLNPLELVPDNQGGAYYSYQIDQNSGRRINRINAQGINVNTGLHGQILFDHNSSFKGMSMLVQQDNSVLCGLNCESQLKLLRVHPNLSISLDVTASVDSGFVYDAQLMQVANGELYWIYVKIVDDQYPLQSITRALKIDSAGNPLWAEPVDLINQTGTISSLTSLELPEGKILVANCSESQARIQAFDSLGNTFLHTNNCNSISALENSFSINRISLHPADAGMVYAAVQRVGGNTSEHAVSAFLIDDTGFVWPQEIEVFRVNQPVYYLYRSSFLYSAQGRLSTVFQETQNGMSSLQHRSVELSGVISQPFCLRQSVNGVIQDPVITPIQDNVFVAYVVTDNPEYPSEEKQHIRYQIISPTGQYLMDTWGNIMSGGAYKKIDYLKALSLDDGMVMLIWAEVKNPFTIRTQLIDASGNQLWEPEGRVIVPNASLYGSPLCYRASYYEGSVYIVWSSTALEIRGQRITDGICQWDSAGKVLVPASSIPPEYYRSSPVAIEDNHLIYMHYRNTGYNYGHPTWLGVLRFDSQGDPMDGFAPGVNCAFVRDPQASEFLEFKSAFVTPMGLLVSCNLYNYSWHDTEQNSYIWGSLTQLVSPQGNILWDAEGWLRLGDKNVILGRDNQGFFFNNTQTFEKLDYQHNQLWSADAWLLNSIKSVEVTPGLFMCLAGDLKYNIFTESTPPVWPSDAILSPATNMNRNIIALSGNAYACWSKYRTDHWDERSSQFFLQRLNTALVAVDDPAAPSCETLSFLCAYPNPFSATLSLQVLSKNICTSRISIYNLRGQLVKTVFSGNLSAGETVVSWDGKDSSGLDSAAGVYFCRINSPGQKDQVRKVVKY